MEQFGEVPEMFLLPLLQFLPLIEVYFLNLDVFLLQSIDFLIFGSQFLSPFVQNSLRFVLIVFHLLLEIIYFLPLPHILHISIRTMTLLLVNPIPQLLVLSFNFFQIFRHPVVIYLVFNQLLLTLFDLLLRFFQLWVYVAGIFGQFGVLIPFCIKFFGKLDYPFVLKAFLCHNIVIQLSFLTAD